MNLIVHIIKIISFDGYPKYVKNKFISNNNPINVIYDIIKKDKYDYYLIDMFSDFDIINGNELNIFRLNSFLLDNKKSEITDEQLEVIEMYYKVL